MILCTVLRETSRPRAPVPSAECSDTGLAVTGLGPKAFDLLFLVGDVPQALLQAGDLAEPLHPLGLSQALAGVGLDLQKPGLLGQVKTEHGAPDTGVFMLARGPIGPVAGAEGDFAEAEDSVAELPAGVRGSSA